MKRTWLGVAVGTLAMLFGSGCKVVVTGADTYETCFTSSDCGNTRDACVEIPGTTDTLAACSHSCSRDTDCEYGGRCLSFDGGGSFFCVQSCTSSATCEIGWSCNSIDTGNNVCLPGTTGPTPTQDTYDSCTSTSECIQTADTCQAVAGTVTLNACTRSCAADTDCPGGGRCLSLDGGSTFQCMQTCTTSGSCATGWSCNVIDTGPSACLPGTAPAGIPAYDECAYGTSPDPCEAGVACWGVTVDTVMAGLCSRECSTDGDCPLDVRGFSGTCLAFPGQPALCWEGCASSADCQTGWACKSMADGLTFPTICVPM